MPEQSLEGFVEVYEEALPYIKCQIQSTIQHESGHRDDESNRYKDIGLGKNTPDFSEFSSESRVEPIAEQEEENCDSLFPAEVSGNAVQVNLNQLFEEVKSISKIDPSYKKDIRAGTLSPEAQGMYLMQDMPNNSSAEVKQKISDEVYEGFDGTLWVDVRKIIEPFLAKNNAAKQTVKPPTFQDDGVVADVPNISQMPPSSSSVPAFPFVPSVPSVPSIGAR